MLVKGMALFSSLKNLFIDILFPSLCLNCGREGTYLCYDCASLVQVFEDQYCPFCRTPKIVPDGKTCFNCRGSKKLNGLFCAASYENKLVRGILHQFKYKPQFAKCLARPLASFIITHLQLINQAEFPTTGIWVPIPLHIKKAKERGFNQAEELAKELSEQLGGELLPDVLRKTRPTRSQTDLPAKEREKNVEGAFKCVGSQTVRGKKILLVDDVFTTGATMEECARVLKAAGAKEVWGVAVARG